MDRRDFLTVTISIPLLAGCVGAIDDGTSTPDDDVDDRPDGIGSQCNDPASDSGKGTSINDNQDDSDAETAFKGNYEQCERTYAGVHFDLPEPAKAEALAAIEDGEYETTDELVLPQAIDIETSYLLLSDDDGVTHYYTATVEKDGDVTRLHANETVPETDPVSFCNATDETVTVDIRLDYANTVGSDVDVESQGEKIFEDTVEVDPGEEIDLNGDVTYRYGNYRAEIAVVDSEVEDVLTWRMWHHYTAHGTLHLRSGGELYYSSEFYHPEGDIPSCKWNDDGELIEGPGS